MIPRVYQAINAVAAAMAQDGVAKTRLNVRDRYLYRSIDDVLERLAPLLAQHRLCILPRVLEREVRDRYDDAGNLLVGVALRVAFDLLSADDGSCHTIEAYGESLDAGDKATAKAMQSAYKYAVLQAFCVPASRSEDADAESYRLKAAPLPGEPPQGWTRWADEFTAQCRMCTDVGSLDRLKAGARGLLTALQRESPKIYRHLGDTVAECSRNLAGKDEAAPISAEAGPVSEPTSSLAARPQRKRRPNLAIAFAKSSSKQDESSAHG